MKELIITGSPASGKTTFFEALLAQKPEFLAVDANLEISLSEGAKIIAREPFKIPMPVRNYMLCAGCALCQKNCPFGAIYEEDLWIDPLECEGCGLCVKNCPNQALQMANMQIGEILSVEEGGRRYLKANLLPGAKGGPRLIKSLRDKAKKEGAFVLDSPPYYGEHLAYLLDEAEMVLVVLRPEDGSFYFLERVSFLAPKARVFVLLNLSDQAPDKVAPLKELVSTKGFEWIGEISRLSPPALKEAFKDKANSLLELAKL